MAAADHLHPAQENFVGYCAELRLDYVSTQILLDLMGWNNQDGGTPRAYMGIAPHVVLAVAAKGEIRAKDEVSLAKEIETTIRHLIGEKQIDVVEADPVEALEQMGLPPSCSAWLIAQLKLEQTASRDIFQEIEAFLYEPSGHMQPIVQQALRSLLIYRRRTTSA